MATPRITEVDYQNFVIELVDSVKKYQGIVDEMENMVNQLTQAKDEIDLYTAQYSQLARVGPRCEECLDKALALCDKSRELCNRHEELASLFSQPDLPSLRLTIRALIYDLNGISSAFFTAVVGLQSAIKWVQDDVEALANTRQHAHVREEPWWRKTMAYLRDGLAVTGAYLMFSSDPQTQAMGNAAALGSAILGFIHTRTERYVRAGPGRLPLAFLSMITDALGNARESAEVVSSLEMGLDQTILRALYLIDDADVRHEVSRYMAERAPSMPVPEPYVW